MLNLGQHNTLEEALHWVNAHRLDHHYGLPGALFGNAACQACRDLEERVKFYHRKDWPGAVPQTVVPGREII